jgi:hypothetical protein
VRERRERKRIGVALVAALIFVLQTFAGVFGPQASAYAGARDQFGNPLCVEGRVAGSPSGDERGVVHLCCSLGCGLCAPMVGATSAERARPQPLGVFIGAGRLAAAPPRPTLFRSGPGNPRAPPLAI